MSERRFRMTAVSPDRGDRTRFTRVGLNRRATAIASALATGAANAVLLGVPGRLPTFDVTTGTRTVITETHKPVAQSDKILERWAHRYSLDPLAGKTVRPDAASQTFSQIEGLMAQGVTIKDVTVKGFASDENTVMQNGQLTAGLGVRSEKNLHLAHKRSTVFERMLQVEFTNRGLTAPDIQILAPHEDILTHKQIGKLHRLAREFKYGSVYDMIVNYNASLKEGAEHDTTAIPEKVRKTLDRYLGDERYVEVNINGTLNGVQIKNITQRRKIPLLYLLPIPIMQLSTAEVTMPGAVTHTVYQQGSDRIDPKGYTRRGFERKQPRPYSETHSARRIHSPRNHGGSLGRQS